MADDTKRCPGAPKYGIPAHDAPLEAFGKQSGNPDGLTRVCKADWNAYSAKLREAKQAGTFSPGRAAVEATEVVAAAPRPRKQRRVASTPQGNRYSEAEPVAEPLAEF